MALTAAPIGDGRGSFCMQSGSNVIESDAQ